MIKPKISVFIENPSLRQRLICFCYNTLLLIVQWLWFKDDFEKYKTETKSLVKDFSEIIKSYDS